MKEKYKAIIENIESSKEGDKVIDTLTKYTYASGVVEAQRNITWRLNNDDKIYLGVDKNKSIGDKTYRWELVDICVVRDSENMNSYEEKVKNRIIEIENKYNMSDKALDLACKEYGIEGVSYYSLYNVRTGYKKVTFTTLKKAEKAIEQLEKALCEGGNVKYNLDLEEIEPETEPIYVTIEVDIRKDNMDALNTYLNAVNLSETDYFNEILDKELKPQKKAINDFLKAMGQLRGDR